MKNIRGFPSCGGVRYSCTSSRRSPTGTAERRSHRLQLNRRFPDHAVERHDNRHSNPTPCLKCRETGDCLAQPTGASERPALGGEMDDLEAIGLSRNGSVAQCGLAAARRGHAVGKRRQQIDGIQTVLSPQRAWETIGAGDRFEIKAARSAGQRQ